MACGLAGSLAYAAVVAWLYVTQPQTVAQVTGGFASIVGAYKVDPQAFADGLRFFRGNQFVEARAALLRADPAERDPQVQFYIAYAYYREGWGRLYSDDALFGKGLAAVDKAIALAPGDGWSWTIRIFRCTRPTSCGPSCSAASSGTPRTSTRCACSGRGNECGARSGAAAADLSDGHAARRRAARAGHRARAAVGLLAGPRDDGGGGARAQPARWRPTASCTDRDRCSRTRTAWSCSMSLFAAASQVLGMLTPRSGLPLFFVDVFLFVLLLNTLVAQPDRVRLLRSLAVILGSALVLKFVVLGALSGPSGQPHGARARGAVRRRDVRHHRAGAAGAGRAATWRSSPSGCSLPASAPCRRPRPFSDSTALER